MKNVFRLLSNGTHFRAEWKGLLFWRILSVSCMYEGPRIPPHERFEWSNDNWRVPVVFESRDEAEGFIRKYYGEDAEIISTWRVL